VFGITKRMSSTKNALLDSALIIEGAALRASAENAKGES
jgi:hypothetical protein